jgi:hypothetical protein
MIKIYNKQTNEFLGRIPQEQLEFLRAHLEGEPLQHTDYYLRRETISDLERAGAPASLLDLLRMALRTEPAVEIRWKKDEPLKV